MVRELKYADKHREAAFVVWKKFQRRAESLADELGASILYYHFPWEERSKLHKLVSYALKFRRTLAALLQRRPSLVVVQLAPTPALYAVALYSRLTGATYVADCHNSMLYAHWVRWPLVRRLLRRGQMLVHNTDVVDQARRHGLDPLVLRDPLPTITVPESDRFLADFGLSPRQYIIVPGNLAADEPLEQTFEAARQLPDVTFVFTWFAERLPASLRAAGPENVIFTGYLAPEAFNAVFANAAAAVVLTTREGTQPSGAAEALALGVPPVLSNISTTRRLYRRAAVYVQNEGRSIAAGIQLALRDYGEMQARMDEVKRQSGGEVRVQLDRLKELLGIDEKISPTANAERVEPDAHPPSVTTPAISASSLR